MFILLLVLSSYCGLGQGAYVGYSVSVLTSHKDESASRVATDASGNGYYLSGFFQKNCTAGGITLYNNATTGGEIRVSNLLDCA